MKARYALIVAAMLFGCSSARMAGVPPELEPRVGEMGFYRDSPLEGTYEVLGTVQGQYNPLESAKQIEWNLKMQAYSAYGEKAEAIIRVYSTVVPGYEFPLREVRGTVIKYKRERRAEKTSTPKGAAPKPEYSLMPEFKLLPEDELMPDMNSEGKVE